MFFYYFNFLIFVSFFSGVVCKFSFRCIIIMKIPMSIAVLCVRFSSLPIPSMTLS